MAIEMTGHGLRVIEGIGMQDIESTIDGAYEQVHGMMRPSDDIQIDLTDVIHKALELLPECPERERAMAAVQLFNYVPYEMIQRATEFSVTYALHGAIDYDADYCTYRWWTSDPSTCTNLKRALPDLDIERFGMDV